MICYGDKLIIYLIYFHLLSRFVFFFFCIRICMTFVFHAMLTWFMAGGNTKAKAMQRQVADKLQTSFGRVSVIFLEYF